MQHFYNIKNYYQNLRLSLIWSHRTPFDISHYLGYSPECDKTICPNL